MTTSAATEVVSGPILVPLDLAALPARTKDVLFHFAALRRVTVEQLIAEAMNEKADRITGDGTPTSAPSRRTAAAA